MTGNAKKQALGRGIAAKAGRRRCAGAPAWPEGELRLQGLGALLLSSSLEMFCRDWVGAGQSKQNLKGAFHVRAPAWATYTHTNTPPVKSRIVFHL